MLLNSARWGGMGRVFPAAVFSVHPRGLELHKSRGYIQTPPQSAGKLRAHYSYRALAGAHTPFRTHCTCAVQPACMCGGSGRVHLPSHVPGSATVIHPHSKKVLKFLCCSLRPVPCKMKLSHSVNKSSIRKKKKSLF